MCWIVSQYQGRRWVTRRNLHIDRLASAWLIKQFIDKRPRFHFVAEGERVEGGIPFDMFGAEFTHQGEDCTFETLIKRFGLGDDRALGEIAEIVHDIDLKDDKFNRLEAAGLNATVTGLSEAAQRRPQTAPAMRRDLRRPVRAVERRRREGQGEGRWR